MVKPFRCEVGNVVLVAFDKNDIFAKISIRAGKQFGGWVGYIAVGTVRFDQRVSEKRNAGELRPLLKRC
jgi:hypothetical protein